MKTLLTTIIAATICLFYSSCKKDNKSDPNSFEVEYKIAPVSNAIVKITYNDQARAPVVVFDAADFQNGAKKITVSAKPFTARIETEVSNQGNVPIVFDLYILVDGQFKKLSNCNAPPMTPSTITVAEYTVQ